MENVPLCDDFSVPLASEEFPARSSCPHWLLDGVKTGRVSCAPVLILEPAHVLEVIRESEVPVYESTEPGHFFWEYI